MIYAAATLVALANQCAPAVAVSALLPVVQVESSGNPLALHINHGPKVSARTLAEAVVLADRYIAAGYSVDIGLGQINSRNLGWLGLGVEQAFEPCTNLGAAARILMAAYTRATSVTTGPAAIAAAYSLYNTGSMSAGLANGYVAKVWRAAGNPQAVAMTGPTDAPDKSAISSSDILAVNEYADVFAQANSSSHGAVSPPEPNAPVPTNASPAPAQVRSILDQRAASSTSTDGSQWVLGEAPASKVMVF